MISHAPLITLFTDASFDDRRNLATWAAWAKFDGQTLRASGIFKRPLTGVNTAETGAIANGLFAVAKRFAPPKGTVVLIQSDSIHALAVVSPRHKNPLMELDNAEVYRWITEFAEARGLILKTRHVKGHRGTRDRRSAVNTWCDTECRRLLVEARAKRTGT